MGLGAFLFLCEDLTIQNCIFQNFDGGPTTGGAVIVNGNGTFMNCEFVNCWANLAGAIWHASGDIKLIGCTFRESGNAAVRIDETSPSFPVSAMIANCEFLDNISNGPSLLAQKALAGTTITECLFRGNINYGTGGGAVTLGQGPKTVENCIFIYNGALASNGQGGAIRGGGIPIPIVLKSNTFVDNYKIANSAPGATLSVGYAIFENNIIVGSQGGAAIDALAFEPDCNVYWDNPDDIGVSLAATDRVVDPEFCDRKALDLTLREGSPCLPDDPLGCGLIGALEQGCGFISIEEKSWGAIKESYR